MSNTNVTCKVKYAGICGSDINKAKEETFLENDILKLGHEIVCLSNTGDLYVVNPFICDSNCTTCTQESYMYCDKVTRLGAGNVEGGFSGEISVKLNNLYRVPDCSHPEVGILCDGMAVVLHGFHMMDFQRVQKLAIIGAGSIGVLAALTAKEEFPHVSIDIFCKSILKKDYLNKQFGDSFNYLDMCDIPAINNCYDVVIEAVGGWQTDTITNSIGVVKNNGTILVFGAFNENCRIVKGLRQLFYKQITLFGINSFCKKCNDFQKAVKWTFAHEELLFSLLTNSYSVNRSRVDANIIHKFVLEHKLLKGYFVYD